MRRGSWLALGFASCFAVSGVARAESSAADKAVARQAATEGIQLFKAGKYPDALDRLRRAQALYDAPVHLLYIARAEEKLGLLVEASEHYRQLDHYSMPPNPPDAWTAAVEDGQKELAAVEPRVPKLRISTEPAAQAASLRIDQVDVSSAALGLPRPVNPGKHHIELSTPGRATAVSDVEVAEGTSRDVIFRLAPASADASSGVVAADAGTTVATTTTPNDAGAKEGPFVGFLGGLRLGVGIPTGTVLNNADLNRDVASSDVATAGGALEFHAGLRLGRYFTPIFFVAGQTFGHPDQLKRTNADAPLNLKSAQAGTFGIGVIVGTPPGKVGGFGELDLGLVNAMTVEIQRPVVDTGNCSATFRGGSIRLGGGVTIPVVSWLQLTPLLSVELGRFTTIDATNCKVEGVLKTYDVIKDGGIDSDNQRTHGMVFLGVGGDVIVGGRR
jgi:hypothetical protein